MPVALATALAVTAFAANSVLCRLALQHGAIDPASFTTIRFTAGAVTLLLIGGRAATQTLRLADARLPALVLFLYAIPFALAYTQLAAGTGALLLFGAVQLTMLMAAWRGGERPSARSWLGFVAALSGLIYLVSPGVAAPPPDGAALMITAGIAWGGYSLLGRRAPDPLAQTTRNFVAVVPLVALVSLVQWTAMHLSAAGVVYAVVSGAITSALGYVVWYHALRSLSAARAAFVQLAVPVLAAIGGIALMGEAMSARLVAASALVLGGIALTLSGRGQR